MHIYLFTLASSGYDRRPALYRYGIVLVGLALFSSTVMRVVGMEQHNSISRAAQCRPSCAPPQHATTELLADAFCLLHELRREKPNTHDITLYLGTAESEVQKPENVLSRTTEAFGGCRLTF